MDTSHTGEILKHLEKRNELLMDAYRTMMHELHKCQVEEEMLMQKFYELMSKHNSNGKIENGDGENNNSNALASASTPEGHIPQNVVGVSENGNLGAIHSTSNDCLLLNNDDDNVSDGGYDYYEDEEDSEDEHSVQ